MFCTNHTELTSQVRVKMILTKVFTTICQRSILYYTKYNHEDIAELKDSQGSSFCCRQVKATLHILDVPDELSQLFSSQSDRDAQYFRKHIRYFNSHFSFATLGVNLDQRYNTPKGSGIYTFRIHGQVYHRLD
jgi:hypothetical protein